VPNSCAQTHSTQRGLETNVKTRILWAVAVVLSCAAVGAAQSEEDTRLHPYTSKHWGFQIDIPKTWGVRESAERTDSRVATVGVAANGGVLPNLVIYLHGGAGDARAFLEDEIPDQDWTGSESTEARARWLRRVNDAVRSVTARRFEGSPRRRSAPPSRWRGRGLRHDPRPLQD
jgi:hypothetical protein